MNSPNEQTDQLDAYNFMLASTVINGTESELHKLLHDEGITCDKTLYCAVLEDNSIIEKLCKFLKSGLRSSFREYFNTVKNNKIVTPFNNNSSNINNNNLLTSTHNKRLRTENKNIINNEFDNSIKESSTSQTVINNTNTKQKWPIELVNILFTKLSIIINENKDTLSDKNKVIKYLKDNKNSKSVVNLIESLNYINLEKITTYYYNSTYDHIRKKFDKIQKDILDICFFHDVEPKVKWFVTIFYI